LTLTEKVFKNKNYSPSQWSFLLSLSLIWIGMVGARVLIAWGMVLFFVTAVYSFLHAKNKVSNWIFLLPTIYFIIHLLSYFNSEDNEMWLFWLNMKMPFLLFPIAFFLSHSEVFGAIDDALKLFVGVMALSVVVVMTNYFFHFEEINESLFSGGRLPVPFSHIRYSLQIVLAILVCFFHFKSKSYRWFTILLFVVVLHFLSVRSGLVIFYSCALFYGIYILVNKRSLKISLLVLGSLLALGLLSIRYVPSLKNRLAYMRYDLSQYKIGKIDGNSDAMRLTSLKIGENLMRENLIWGVGTGDILKKSKEIGKVIAPSAANESIKMPHNQFLWIGVSTGIIGLIGFLFAFLFPFIYFKSNIQLDFLMLYLVFGISFLVEYTLEEQIGGTLFVLFSLIFFTKMIHQKCQA
jgi:O-antigen ligase